MLLTELPRARLLCIGDVMLDYFIYGRVQRISPEAPVPVFHVQQKTKVLGGAGNVIRNLASLGVAVHFLSLIGRDAAGSSVKRLLEELPSITYDLYEEAERPTITKTRYLSQNQQLLRADEEELHPLPREAEEILLESFKARLPSVDAIVLSDYGKGVLTSSFIKLLIEQALKAGKPVIVDPKGSDYTVYEGATFITPNLKELGEATRLSVKTNEEIVQAVGELQKSCRISNVLVTRSEKGMTLVEGQNEPLHIPTHAREVFDVSGAGDTVVAFLSASLAVGASYEEAARLANVAAGIVVGKVGTATVRLQEVDEILRSSDRHGHDAKILSREEAWEQVLVWKRRGLKVGFTNGCFDLLHPGHVSLLREARSNCDRLILGLNSDASVKRLKGEKRPLNSEIARAKVLASLADVDLVVVFDEDTPLELIKFLKPDLLVKGSDYTLDQVVGAREVRSWGGEVYLAELISGHSTTSTLQKISA